MTLIGHKVFLNEPNSSTQQGHLRSSCETSPGYTYLIGIKNLQKNNVNNCDQNRGQELPSTTEINTTLSARSGLGIGADKKPTETSLELFCSVTWRYTKTPLLSGSAQSLPQGDEPKQTGCHKLKQSHGSGGDFSRKAPAYTRRGQSKEIYLQT